MTHSLHRLGTKENLLDDFTVYCLPAIGINDKGSGTKRWRFLELALKNNAANAGQADIGNIYTISRNEFFEKVKKRFDNSLNDGEGDGMCPCICFDSRDNLLNLLKEAIDADFGLSIMVQGVLEEVISLLKEINLKPHTVHHSLGIWGRIEKLPEKEILEITTMCGHGMTTPGLVKTCIEEIRAGKMSPQEAAQTLARPCICGIFNPTRAEKLLKQIIKKG